HSAARDLKRVTARRLEVSGGAVVANPTGLSRVSQHTCGATGHAADQTKHHAHRSEHRGELQRAGELPNRTRTARQRGGDDRFTAPARLPTDPFAQSYHTDLSRA